MSIENIKVANIDELYDKIQNVCTRLKIDSVVSKEKSRVYISRGEEKSVLLIQAGKDGFTIDTRSGASIELNFEVEDNFDI